MKIELKSEIIEKRILGKDLKVSAIGLGWMEMSYAYGQGDKKDSLATTDAKED